MKPLQGFFSILGWATAIGLMLVLVVPRDETPEAEAQYVRLSNDEGTCTVEVFREKSEIVLTAVDGDHINTVRIHKPENGEIVLRESTTLTLREMPPSGMQTMLVEIGNGPTYLVTDPRLNIFKEQCAEYVAGLADWVRIELYGFYGIP